MSSTNPSSTGWEPPLPEDLQRMLPQYEITGILGRGGMGAVYKGRQANLERDVAIKVLPETFTNGDDELNFVARFKQEARAMAKLDHPAIISVFDFGETSEGQLYFIMEFIDGMDIHQYIKHHGGKLPQEHALSITAHVLDALDYAHNHGVIHRDIKPANILLNREGRVKIADFGLAKRFGEGVDDSAPALTMSNMALGTPDFVAPEALEAGRTVDHRADLYAVGVMLYQMLTGKLPRGQFKSPSEANPEIDPRLDAIVSRAMQSDPDDRYASASAVRLDLDHILSQPLARVEAGEDSGEVPVAVPVTDTLKAGGKPAARGRTTAAQPQPAGPPPRSQTPLYLGIGLAAAVALGFGVFWIFGPDRDITVPPTTGEGQETATKSAEAKEPTHQPTPAQAPAKTRPLPEQVKSSAPADSETELFPVGQWVKLDGSPHLKDLAVRADGWLSPMASIYSLPGINGSNHGIRWVTRMVSPLSGNDAQFLEVRHSSASNGKSAYQALISASQKSFTLRYDSLEDKNPMILKILADSLEDGSQYSIEFAAVGDKLVCRMNGKLLAVVADPNLKSGGLAFRNIFPVRDIEVINLDGLPETEALKLLGVDAKGSDLRVPTLTKAEAPAAPQPVPTPGTTPPAPATSPPSTPSVASTATPAPSPLASLPGLKTRLDGYHSARRTQLGDLAAKYLGGLETRLGQAADAGDLRLATAFEAEKKHVQTLQTAFAQPPADPVAAVTDVGTVALPPLPDGSPEPLAALRQTWTTESAKIRTALDAALQQSLQALEAELTRARDFENAQAVLAWREGLAKGPEVVGQAPRLPAGPQPMAAATPAAGAAALQPPSDLARATKDAPFENSLGMKFVPVPGTEVLFCIHETRYRDYEEYAKAQENVEGSWKNQTNNGFELKADEEDHPVLRVNWGDAQKFCAWLSEKEGKTYRLPTDREWSLAVGIGREEEWKSDTTPATVFKPQDTFPWGVEWPPPQGAGNYSDESRRAKGARDDATYLDGYDDGFPTTAPVMSFEPNKLGLFDLGGNVWEWCEDWDSDEQKERVLRGGSWDSSEHGSLLSSRRGRGAPDDRHFDKGFRVVLASSPPAAIAGRTEAGPPGSMPPATGSVPPPAPDPALARATKDAPFENTLGMKFVPVPGTDVLFCIHETRYRDYEEYAKKAKESVDGAWKTQTNDGLEIKRYAEDHPITRVSWDDAQSFCRWLSEKEGKTYRLPTDREWSLAIGIGDQEDWKADTTPGTVFKLPDVFPWGDEWPPPQGAGNYSDESRRAKAPRDEATYLDGYDDGFPTTAPVMSFEANKLGIFDLGGNVWEWCEDWYSVEQKERVLRGGSWFYGVRGYLLSSYRIRATTDYRNDHYGFRVVLVGSASSGPAAVAGRTEAGPPGSMPPATGAVPSKAPDPALARATKDAPFENSLGMKFVPVPGTDVLFAIHETRWKDYAEYAKANPGIDQKWQSQTHDGFAITDRPGDHPVVQVSWEEAQAFCSWLSQREGKTYRLPTDREWSVAVGIGREEDWKRDTTPETVNKPDDIYPWGAEWPPPRGAGNYSDESRKTKAPAPNIRYFEGYDDGSPFTAPVMSFEANRPGLFDLGGNVWEWCEDWYSGDQKERVLRGGSWDSHERGYLPSSRRHPKAPATRHYGIGFRVVLVAVPAE